jgi:hypothetical protein
VTWLSVQHNLGQKPVQHRQMHRRFSIIKMLYLEYDATTRTHRLFMIDTLWAITREPYRSSRRVSCKVGQDTRTMNAVVYLQGNGS